MAQSRVVRWWVELRKVCGRVAVDNYAFTKHHKSCVVRCVGRDVCEVCGRVVHTVPCIHPSGLSLSPLVVQLGQLGRLCGCHVFVGWVTWVVSWVGCVPVGCGLRGWIYSWLVLLCCADVLHGIHACTLSF